ncbi:alcohol dehydrogenase catalytic domain-containing protein [Micromonospora sp. DT63]|uniref:alcohol dehydrogenase catalytic domain-containing protein n=1 Tax=Micromonospora sp. DT63 TaxID=3393441 RepID=UPI003CE8F07B
MRAVVLSEFGGPLVVQEVDTPVPGAGQVLVRVAASGVNPLDTKIRQGKAPHARNHPPVVLGLDLAGVVAEVGPGVVGFAPGDECTGSPAGSVMSRDRSPSTRRSTPGCWPGRRSR